MNERWDNNLLMAAVCHGVGRAEFIRDVEEWAVNQDVVDKMSASDNVDENWMTISNGIKNVAKKHFAEMRRP
eukprot:5227168-Karenia_brevis.AAC.1